MAGASLLALLDDIASAEAELAALRTTLQNPVLETQRAAVNSAKSILTEKREDLERLAQGLLEYETLTGNEITKVIAGEPLNRGDDDDTPTDNGNSPSLTAIPKTKPKAPKADPDPDMEPDPTA